MGFTKFAVSEEKLEPVTTDKLEKVEEGKKPTLSTTKPEVSR